MKNLIPWRQNVFFAPHFYKEMDRFFEKFFKERSMMSKDFFDTQNIFPKLDIIDGKKEVIVKAEIPGIDPKNIDITLSGRVLSLKGEKQQEKDELERRRDPVANLNG